jgi:thioredoxin reductase (NADPH)
MSRFDAGIVLAAPQAMSNACEHLAALTEHRPHPVTPSALGCEECLESGDEWVQLRLCLSCGHVGCCDSSPNRHATAHFHRTEHPVIKAFEPMANWGYCYVDEVMVDEVEAYPEESPAVHYEQPRA